MDKENAPYIEVLEQPASKEFRFRYECERRSHGSLPGVHSTVWKKTYPKIKIVGLNTDAHLIISCVSKEAPYKVHPHRIVSKGKGTNNGVFVTTVGPDENEIELKNLGIQCVRKKDIKKSLEERKKVRVDPFQQGYDHGDHPTSIDLNVVRLCFQVFLFDHTTEKYTKKLTPVVSDPIYDKQTAVNLSISKLSTEVASVAGGTSLVIFGQKIIKEDVKVRFFETQEDKVIWEASEDSLPRNNYDNQMSITVKTPAYPTKDTGEPVQLMIQLTKPSTGEAGKAIPFTFLSPASFNDAVNTPMDLSSKRKRSEFRDLFEPSEIPTCDRLQAPNQPEFPNPNDLGNITRMQDTESLDDSPNIPQDGQENFYYNRNSNTEGYTTHLPKKPKYSERLPFSRAQALPLHPVYPPLLMNPNAPPVMVNNLIYDCQCYPPMLPRYNPFVPFMPPTSPYIYQYPFFGNGLPNVQDRPQVLIDDHPHWHVQPAPTWSPLVVKMSTPRISSM
ncbi:embryonic polarity protein dorsal [Diachasma alloeum]|uniref:embryonic polarity protein dorsal n=1 Tax=Diachasma alloeum TaxID=454923 RepID=UPI0007384F18|nr:embryonic polarity protein dorsal [Diachasma alloeum]